MCLILFAYRVDETYPLIVAANRDESYDRPTEQAHFWKDHPDLLAGRDLDKKGTWMGVTRTGRFAALTNYRDPKQLKEGKRSRGELVARFLTGNEAPERYMQEAARNRDLYPGYNLLAGTVDELYYYSNIEHRIRKLEPGIYGVSNHLLDTEWPKVVRGKAGLSAVIRQGPQDNLAERLLALLQSSEPAPDELLPDTGVSKELERILSPMFITSEGYGTRSSTAILLSEKRIFFKERALAPVGKGDREFWVEVGK